MKSMERTRGELLPVFGAAAVAFTFSLAAAFDWLWWGLLAAIAAVAAVLFLCNSAKNMTEKKCAGAVLAVPVLSFAVNQTGVLFTLVGVKGSLSDYATVVEAVAAVAMAIFSALLWHVTGKQAETTRRMGKIQEKLAESELYPRLSYSVLVGQTILGKEPKNAHVILEIHNISKKDVEIAEAGYNGVSLYRVVRDASISLAPLRIVGSAPVALPSGEKVLFWLDGSSKGKENEVIYSITIKGDFYEIDKAQKIKTIYQCISVKTKNGTYSGRKAELSVYDGPCEADN